MTDDPVEAQYPTKEQAARLMSLSMPPFEKFLEHCNTLKSECDKAGELTPERAGLFDEYRAALAADRETYENEVADVICAQLTSQEVELLISFYEGPMHAAVEKALGLGAVINNLGTSWQTKVLERCPGMWQMLVTNVGKWQEKNSPAGSEVLLPDAPGGSDGWKRVDAPMQAEELPTAPEEEAELAQMRGGSDTLQ